MDINEIERAWNDPEPRMPTWKYDESIRWLIARVRELEGILADTRSNVAEHQQALRECADMIVGQKKRIAELEADVNWLREQLGIWQSKACVLEADKARLDWLLYKGLALYGDRSGIDIDMGQEPWVSADRR